MAVASITTAFHNADLQGVVLSYRRIVLRDAMSGKKVVYVPLSTVSDPAAESSAEIARRQAAIIDKKVAEIWRLQADIKRKDKAIEDLKRDLSNSRRRNKRLASLLSEAGGLLDIIQQLVDECRRGGGELSEGVCWSFKEKVRNWRKRVNKAASAES